MRKTDGLIVKLCPQYSVKNLTLQWVVTTMEWINKKKFTVNPCINLFPQHQPPSNAIWDDKKFMLHSTAQEQNCNRGKFSIFLLSSVLKKLHRKSCWDFSHDFNSLNLYQPNYLLLGLLLCSTFYMFYDFGILPCIEIIFLLSFAILLGIIL